MKREELQQIAARWTEELWQKQNFEAIDTLHSEDFRDHSPAGRKNDNEGFLQGVMSIYTSFPDFKADAVDYIIDTESNQVCIKWTAKGTFKSTFMGFKPSGREIQFRGIDILKIEDGKVKERWGEWDGVDLMEQMLQTSVAEVINKI